MSKKCYWKSILKKSQKFFKFKLNFETSECSRRLDKKFLKISALATYKGITDSEEKEHKRSKKMNGKKK